MLDSSFTRVAIAFALCGLTTAVVSYAILSVWSYGSGAWFVATISGFGAGLALAMREYAHQRGNQSDETAEGF